jgi:hypothetical protein
MTPQILQLREQLIDARKDVATFSELADPLYADLENQIQAVKDAHRQANAEIYDNLDSAASRLIKVEEEIRIAMVSVFESCGEKQLAPGLSIRVNSKLQYDIASAVRWAETNAPVLIEKTINKAAFESLPSTPDLEFVRTETTPIAVISKNLAEAK